MEDYIVSISDIIIWTVKIAVHLITLPRLPKWKGDNNMVSHGTFNTIDMGKPKITVGKSYGLHHFIWEASENNWAVIWGDAIFLLLVCSTDFDILWCNGLFSHHIKFHCFLFMHKFSPTRHYVADDL